MFITNQHFVFFEVQTKVNVKELHKCKVHNTHQQMLQHVVDNTEELLEDLEHCTLVIRCNDITQMYEICDHRGIWSEIDDLDIANGLEEFISEYEV